ncbi:MAG TPA: N-acetyltransferase [Pirellulales bacterium]|nr:N-acetyltransferase [Pirellulales bacterium]
MADATIEVQPTRSWRDRRAFMKFAWDHYRNDPMWIPPLRGEFKRLVGWKYHPFQEIGEVQTFIARRNGQVVGRIAGIVNHEHNRHHHERRGFWGFFDCIDDKAVAHALFDAVRSWLAERNLHALRGPVNPSFNYEIGLLIEGFDDPPTFMMTYNPPYYAALIESYGFAKAHDLFAYIGYKKDLDHQVPRVATLVNRVTETFNVKTRPMDRGRFQEDLETFLHVYNASFLHIWGFVPITRAEIQWTARDLKHLIIPELTCVAEVEGKAIGAVFGLPDYNPRIKAIDGRLFPFGFLKLLSKKRNLKRVRLISTNVIPEYQKWGIGVVLLISLVPKGLAIGMEEAEFSWVSEANTLAVASLEKGGARLYKKYRLYDLAATEHLAKINDQ